MSHPETTRLLATEAATAARSALVATTIVRTQLAQRPVDAWLTTAEAMIYLGMRSTSGVRSAIARGLRVDGRGPSRMALFRRRTLDEWLETAGAGFPRGDPTAIAVADPRE